MKPMRLIALVVLVGVLLAQAGMAQTVKITRVAMSPRLLGTYTGFPVSTGMRTVPQGMKVYLKADTTGAVTTYAWSVVEAPSGSTSAFDDAAAMSTTITPDKSGRYIVKVAVNGGAEASDTLYASTYMGTPATGLSCTMCHATAGNAWKETKHATMFKRGITGELEVEEHNGQMVGVYNKSCIKCHTTGWEPNVDNGNFGFEAKKTGYDTTWYKGAEFYNNEYLIPQGDQSRWVDLNTNFPTVAPTASIGCESCHGPGKDHGMNGGNKGMISISYAAGSCMQCHDAPNKHRLGSYWAASAHSNLALSSSAASRSGCWPCHNGEAFAAYAANMNAPDYSKTGVLASISCVTCHDPHSAANPNQLRLVTMKPLLNGYVPPAGMGGKGQLCMNCHRSRYDGKEKVEAQARVFGDRFYAHYSPQGDMLVGSNAYEYGLPLQGLTSHGHLKDGCVTCHMTTRVNGSSMHSNHEMKMHDSEGKPILDACKTCHGENMTSFDDVQAFSDYDGDGTVEGAQTEIEGLLAQLKAILPKNSAGDVVSMRVDSMLVKNDKNWPNNLGAIYNYYFVKYDFSHGVHNMKYSVAILKAALGNLTGVEPTDQNMPNTFALSQNYPNPFNPSTTIQFSIPRAADVHLAVYNSAGKLVATLADGPVAPGNYTAKWDAASMTSGIYFYRLTATSKGSSIYNTTKKMVLMK